MTAKCSTAAVTAVEVVRGQESGSHMRGGEPEKFDRWIRESVGEIVKNLREAPLFVHVYGGGGPDSRLKTERAVAEDWSELKGKWVKGEEPSPEGIILVEELKEDDLGIFEEVEGQNGDCEKAWGVLIQGKGEDGGVACYLLKTSRVGCGNLGVFCTHYCLVKVQSFRETARSQLTSCWLV
ncbi:uncharacterized protein LOC110704373 [Chenopodium quinoa]|uniref:uncharacterized protein LOC110704373 n=1 Tax=Chenopodium quinoa TaxID=63459 RepID=UPI000B791D61|nr:uncharacterized protein LOC110704373 [Chenopodium quinoa]